MWWLIAVGLVCIVTALWLLYAQREPTPKSAVSRVREIQSHSLRKQQPPRKTFQFLANIFLSPFYLAYLIFNFLRRSFAEYRAKIKNRPNRRDKRNEVIEVPYISEATIKKIQRKGITYRDEQ